MPVDAQQTLCDDATTGAELALWRRWRDGRDEAARERLLEIHLPYARVLAATFYARRHGEEVPFDEYLQLATLGMVEAMERFDPGRGVQFRTFAARRMHGALVDGLECATERQQQIAAQQRLQAQRAESLARQQDEGDEPPDAAPPRTTDQVLQYVAEAGLAFALSWLLDGSGMVEAAEPSVSLPFYRSVELQQLRQRIVEAVADLPATERTVIHDHYFQQLPFEEIATRQCLSRGRISQLHRKALTRLRQRLRDPGLCDLVA